MDAAFGWLGSLVEWVGSFFPRLSVITKTHAGVAFVRGKHVKRIGPGLVLWWPFWTELLLYPVVRQSLNLPSQSLTTIDEQTVTASGVLIYEISDVVRALSTQYDLNETIRDLTMASMREVICGSSFKDTNQNRQRLDLRITKELQPVLADYGVKVLDYRLTDFAKTKVFTVVDGGIADDITPIEDSDDEE